jgi:hypothetical protein
MGATKTYQQKGNRGRMPVESDEFGRLRYASALRLTLSCSLPWTAAMPSKREAANNAFLFLRILAFKPKA